MKKMHLGLMVLLLVSLSLQASLKVSGDEKLFREAKILIFDKKWEEAQQKLERILRDYPQSPIYPQALFYKAKCLEEQRGREEEALKVYASFLEQTDISSSLREQAKVSLIDLAYSLYEKGERNYLQQIEEMLNSSNQAIKYYAALQLSHAEDKKIAQKAVPVLKEILKKERDEDLRDRAKIALLRVEPEELKEYKDEQLAKEAKILKIRVYEKGKKEPKLFINIPWALADLALSSFSEQQKQILREKGYDLDRLMKELSEFEGKVIEIKGEDGIIKIWID